MTVLYCRNRSGLILVLAISNSTFASSHSFLVTELIKRASWCLLYQLFVVLLLSAVLIACNRLTSRNSEITTHLFVISGLALVRCLQVTTSCIKTFLSKNVRFLLLLWHIFTAYNIDNLFLNLNFMHFLRNRKFLQTDITKS